MGWGVALAALAATLAGSKISADAQKAAIRERQQKTEEGIRQRTKKANERLTPIFKQAAEDVGTEKEKELFTAEDAKNLATINKTKSMVNNRLTGGLETGGKQSARFQSLQSDRFTKAKAGQDKRDLAMSRFLSPSRVGQIRGQAIPEVAFGRASVGDELVADRNINDMRVSAIRPDSGMMALGDALRIAGMMAGMYNMGAGLGAEAGVNAGTANTSSLSLGANGSVNVVPNAVGSSGQIASGSWLGSAPSAAPWYQSIGNSFSDFFNPTDGILPTHHTIMPVQQSHTLTPFSRAAVGNPGNASQGWATNRFAPKAWNNSGSAWFDSMR
jgi:hypothetical protein